MIKSVKRHCLKYHLYFQALDKLRASHSIASQESNPDAEFVTGITENEAATPLPSPKPSSHPYEPLLKHDSIKARKTSEEIIENPLSYKEFAPNEDGNLSSVSILCFIYQGS